MSENKKSGGSKPQTINKPKIKKPEGSPVCFGNYPSKPDPGAKCRSCKFAKGCKK
jgi:hypothetical protein